MLSLKLVRSLVLRGTIDHPFHKNNKSTHDSDDEEEHHHHPCLIFLPTRETIHETYKLAIIARDMGLNFSPDPSLSNIIFSFPSSPNKPIISLPFPFLSSAPLPHLRRIVRFSRGLFKLASRRPGPNICHSRSLSLFSRVTRQCIEDVDAFSRVLTSSGWSLFKANNNRCASDSGSSSSSASWSSSSSNGVDVEYYVFRKVEANRVRVGLWKSKAGDGDFDRVRELRLPGLDFRNAPLKVLHYVLLMTDDLFYLA